MRRLKIVDLYVPTPVPTAQELTNGWSAPAWCARFCKGRTVEVPHRGQVETADHPAKERTLAMGRRWGKSSVAGEVVVPRWSLQHPDTQTNIFALFQAQSEIIFNYMCGIVINRPLEALLDRIVWSPFPCLSWKNGAEVWAKNLAHNGKAARGFSSDFTVMDERGFIPDETVQEVVYPMMAASKWGYVFQPSTPNGYNDFFEAWKRGQSRADEHRFKSWRWPSWTNPYLDQAELRSQRERMTELAWRVEFGAEFLDDTAAQFPAYLIDAVTEQNLECPKQPVFDHTYVLGYDPADLIDRSAVVVIDVSTWPWEVVYVDNIAGRGYVQQRVDIRRICERYNGAYAFMDSTKHDPLLEEMQAENIPIAGKRWTNEWKREMMDGLRLAMEQKMFVMPYHYDLIEDLKFFRREVTDFGRIKMGAASGHHDDYVAALAAAVFLAKQSENDKIEVSFIY